MGGLHFSSCCQSFVRDVCCWFKLEPHLSVNRFHLGLTHLQYVPFLPTISLWTLMYLAKWELRSNRKKNVTTMIHFEWILDTHYSWKVTYYYTYVYYLIHHYKLNFMALYEHVRPFVSRLAISVYFWFQQLANWVGKLGRQQIGLFWQWELSQHKWKKLNVPNTND